MTSPIVLKVVFGFFVLIGIGLTIDVILAIIYWDRWQMLFKKNLSEVPWILKDILYLFIIIIVLL